LVRRGFLFWSVGEPYPDTLREVEAFAQRHAGFLAQERARNPEAHRQIEAALAILARVPDRPPLPGDELPDRA
jgi:hypothetical protein